MLRPCCGELDGQCSLTSPQLCWFFNGRFHLHAEHCTEVLTGYFMTIGVMFSFLYYFPSWKRKRGRNNLARNWQIRMWHWEPSFSAAGRLPSRALYFRRGRRTYQLRHKLFSTAIKSMVEICYIHLSAPRNSGLFPHYVYPNMDLTGPGKLSRRPARSTVASHYWRWWASGKIHRIHRECSG